MQKTCFPYYMNVRLIFFNATTTSNDNRHAYVKVLKKKEVDDWNM